MTKEKGNVHLFSQKEFHEILRQERLRSDRDHITFSLILFDLKDNKLKKKKIKEFLAIIQQRLRSIDILGWFDKEIIGLILIATNIEGTNDFLVKLCKNEIVSLMNINYSMYCYPDEWAIENRNLLYNTTNTENFYHQLQNSTVDYKINKQFDFKPSFEIENNFKTAVSYKTPWWKRLLDFYIASMAIIFLSPLYLIIIFYIKITSKGPIFFMQKRVGFKGNVFKMYKFRTMHHDTNIKFHENKMVDAIKSDKAMVKLDKYDPRIFPGGKLLRASSIDELPQLFNILKGEMSIVGPRPCIPYEAEAYMRWHRHRFDLLPGLTGLWQVSGKNKLTFQQMIRLDIKYAKNMSIWFDLEIILRTIPTVIELFLESKLNKAKKK